MSETVDDKLEFLKESLDLLNDSLGRVVQLAIANTDENSCDNRESFIHQELNSILQRHNDQSMKINYKYLKDM